MAGIKGIGESPPLVVVLMVKATMAQISTWVRIYDDNVKDDLLSRVVLAIFHAESRAH